MNVMERIGSSYVCLIRPSATDGGDPQAIQFLRDIASTIEDEAVCGLINGASWRERLVGIYFAVVLGADRFLQSPSCSR